MPRVEPRPERLKRCHGPCGELLPITCFSRARANADGRRGECRACRSERRAELAHGSVRFKPWQRTRSRRERTLAERLAAALDLIDEILPPSGCRAWKVSRRTMAEWRLRRAGLDVHGATLAARDPSVGGSKA